MGHFSLGRFLIQPFRIALSARLKGGVDVHFQKISLPHDLARQTTQATIRTDKRTNSDQATVHEEFGHLSDPADVFAPVLLGKSQPAIQTRTQVVAIQQHRRPPLGMKRALQQMRQRAFARSRQSVEPDHRRPLAQKQFFRLATKLAVKFRMNVGTHMLAPINVWMPHSVLSNPSHRPARSPSPEPASLVHGQHPME